MDKDAHRTASSMLRLCCVSAALGTAVSSSSEDSVDVVTLGVIQPPLAGQTRLAGISSSSKGWGSSMDVGESESLDQTLIRLLRHTFDLDGPVESPFDEQQHKRRQQTSAVIEEEDANVHRSGKKYSEHVEQDTVMLGEMVRQPKSTGRKTSGADAPFTEERENVFDVGDGCGNGGGDIRVPAREGHKQNEPEDASSPNEVEQEEYTAAASHHDVDDNTAADIVTGSSLLDLDCEKVADGDGKYGDADDGSDDGLAALAKISSEAPDGNGGGSAPLDPEDVDGGDPAVATSPNDTNISDLAAQLELIVLGEEDALHHGTAEEADTAEGNAFAKEKLATMATFPSSDTDDDRETSAAGESLAGERSLFGDGGTGQGALEIAEDGLVEESRVEPGSEQAASAEASTTIVTETTAPAAQGVPDYVFEQTDGRGVGATDSIPRTPLQTKPTLDNESIGVGGSRGRAAERIPDSEAEDSENKFRAEMRHVAERSEVASPTPIAVFEKLESEKAAEGGQKDTSDAVGDGSTEGHTVVAEGGAVPSEVVEILERFQGAGEAEDVDRTYDELRNDATEDGSADSHGGVFGIDEPLEELTGHQRPADVVLSLASEQAPMSPVVETPESVPEDPASDSTASDGVPPSSDDILGLAANRSGSVESSKMGGSAADGAKTRSPRKLPVFGKPAPKTGPLGGGAGSSDNGFPGKRPGMFGMLNLPVADPSAWTLPPLPTMDGVPSDDREGEERDRSSREGAVVEIQEGSLWRSWGKNWARAAKKHATRWAKVAGETGVGWGEKAFEWFWARALKLWRDHFRAPSERARRRLDALGRYVLDEVGEYMADPVFAELL